MCLEIGNRVAVIDEIIEGVVVAIADDKISIESDQLIFVFKKTELVKINNQQHNLSKYTNINNPFLKEKIQPKRKKASTFKRIKNQTLMEVDLHIEKLLKSTKAMDNFDILNYQINTAKRKLEYCIKKRIPRLVFIHGVGKGILKTELYFLLNKYPVSYQDASFKKYGLGATEVTI